jgi:hypothetical protein
MKVRRWVAFQRIGFRLPLPGFVLISAGFLVALVVSDLAGFDLDSRIGYTIVLLINPLWAATILFAALKYRIPQLPRVVQRKIMVVPRVHPEAAHLMVQFKPIRCG